MMAPPVARPLPPRAAAAAARRIERRALLAVERAARAYAAHTHGNIGGRQRAEYEARAEAREDLRDALAELDVVRRG